MAAAGSSNKNLHSSCSPVPARPTNGISRNSEMSNPMRRSFSGTPCSKPSISANQRSGFIPNAPNNSPSENSRRHSTSRENWDSRVSFRDHEKENRNNDHSLKHTRVRSLSPSKGRKHFMSPTISAASKVNASARKKILAERSEVRSSISFNDAKIPGVEDLESKSEKGMDQKKNAVSGNVMEDLESKFEEGVHKKKEVSFDSTVTFIEDENLYSKEEDTDNKELDVGYDCVNLDPSFKISPKAVSYFPSPALAPLDADPSVPPPYDPKTNYLSPRPVFLHYRPNPRIGDGKQLEETFKSECLPDASEEESLSEDSQKESEDASSCDQSMVEDDEQEKGEEEEDEDSSNMSEGMVGIRKRTNSPFITIAKLAALVLAVAAFFLYGSFANSPIVDPSVLNNSPRITELIRQDFDDVAQRFQLRLAHTLSSTSDVINNLREGPKIGPLQYVNLTMLEGGSVDVFDGNVLGAGMNYGNSISEHVEEGEVDDGEDKLVESFEGIIGESVESCDDSDEFVDVDGQESEEQEIAPFDDNVEIPVEHEEHVVQEAKYTAIATTILDETPATELQGIQVLEDEPLPISQISEIHHEVEDSSQLRSTHEPSSESLLVIEPNAPVLQTAEAELQVPDTVQLPLGSEFLVIEPAAPILRTSETDPASDTKYFAVESTDEPSSELLLVSEPSALVLQTAETQLQVPDTVQLPLSSEFLVMEPAAPILQTSETEPDTAEEVDSASDTKSFAAESIQESLVVDEKEVDNSGSDRKYFAVDQESLVVDEKAASSAAIIISTLDKLLPSPYEVSFLIFGLLVAICFVCMSTRSTNAPDNHHLATQYQLLVLMTKILRLTTTRRNRPIPAEHNLQDEPESRNLATEVDMVGDSCPSENSLSSYSKKDTTTRHHSSAQSQETKPRKNNHRRESSATSDHSVSDGATASYGSFTTYERIQMKQGNADEGVMVTPVRRSSRIRKQVTSPETQI